MPNTVYHIPETQPLIKIAPSILSADFTRMGEQVAEAEAAGPPLLVLMRFYADEQFDKSVAHLRRKHKEKREGSGK